MDGPQVEREPAPTPGAPLTGTPFEAEARSVLGRVRGAYVRLVGELGGAPRPVDLQQALSLDKKLAWRVHRLATAGDPLDGASYVPSPASAKRLATAAGGRGVSETVTRDLLDATTAFEQLVTARAGDRATFDAMAAALRGPVEGALEQQLQHDARRAAFRANVVLHGKQSDVLVHTFLAAPGSEPGTFDGVSIRGHVGLTRLRPDAALLLAKHRFDTDGEPMGRPEPLDPEAAARHGVSVLGAFSSPDLRLEQDEAGGFRRTHLAHPDLGRHGAVDCLMGDVSRDMPRSPDGMGNLCELATPTRLLVHDMILHEDLGFGAPELRVLARRDAADSWPGDDPVPTLPPGATVQDLGPGSDGFGLLPWAPYAECLQWTLERLGWDPARLRTWRAVVEYPVLHSVVWMRATPR